MVVVVTTAAEPLNSADPLVTTGAEPRKTVDPQSELFATLALFDGGDPFFASPLSADRFLPTFLGRRKKREIK